jgi:hypothetical protein
MTDPQINPTLEGPTEVSPMSSEEAAKIVQDDDALNAHYNDDAATDDDARTPDTAPTGE